MLEAFVQGSLDTSVRADFEHHIDTCSDCALTVAELARLFGSSTRGTGGHTRAHHDADSSLVNVGRYQLGPRLGAGGMGVVFEAHDPELHRRVAIKLLHPGSDDAEATRNRLLREARAMARLAHPNVVSIHDVGRAGEQVFVAMELIEGATLTQWLAASQRTQQEIVDIFVQAGRGLQAAHDVGLVHRDFKPDNVLVGTDNRARVTDFGLARPSLSWTEGHEESGTVADGDAMLLSTSVTTAHGTITGTPAYMAPEQWRGQDADARSDQFSFCVALYEALASRRPFRGHTWPTLCHSVLGGRVEPPPRSMPGWLRTAVMRGLVIHADRRHASMATLLTALSRDRGRALRIGAIAGAMVVGAAATVGVLAWGSRETDPAPDVGQGGREDVSAASTGPDGDESTGSAETQETADLGAATGSATPMAVCLERARTVDRHWTTARRTNLVVRMQEMSLGSELTSQTLSVLDAWAEAYATQATGLCSPAPQLKHLDARRRCLDVSAARLDAWVAVAVEESLTRVQTNIAAAAYDLPNLQHCELEGWLGATASALPVGSVAPKVHLLGSDLAAIEAKLAMRQFPALLDGAGRVAEQAVKLEFPPLIAQTQLTAGLVSAASRDEDAAVTWLEQAVVTADLADHGTVQGQAALALIVQQGGRQLQTVTAQRWRRLARTLADSAHEPRFFAALLLAEATLQAAQLDLVDAKGTLELAIPAHDKAYPKDHPQRALAHTQLASVLWVLNADTEATRHAELACAMLRKTVGPEDLHLAAAQRVLAQVHLAGGRFDEAKHAIDIAVTIPFPGTSLRHDYDRGDALLIRGDIEAASGDVEAALLTYESARVFHYIGPIMAEPDLRLGALMLATGRVEEGLRALQAGLTTMLSHYEPDDPRLIAGFRALGRGQTKARKYKAARKTLLHAQALAHGQFGYGSRNAQALTDLGELEQAAGDKARALELLDDAHVPTVTAYGMGHPILDTTLLARADLAFALGNKAYAGRLYRSMLPRLTERRGEDAKGVKRARARQTDDE